MGLILNIMYNFKELENNIRTLKNWINDKGGLNLPEIMDLLLEKFKSPLNEEEISKFFTGLETLKLTDYPDVDRKYNKSSILKGDIRKYGKIIRSEDGTYDFLNKLDTNYTQLSKFMCYLLEKMINDENEEIKAKGVYFYSKITKNLENGLLEFRNEIEYFANYYLKTKNDYKDVFVDELVHLTNVGDYAESLTRDYLLNNGFKIVYNGGNGDFIDKIFGIDYIVHHRHYGYKTFQVKHNSFDLEKTFSRYARLGINYGVVANKKKFKVFDLQNNYKEFDILNIDFVINFISFKNKFIKYDGIDMSINKDDKSKLLHVKKCFSLEQDNEIYTIGMIYDKKINHPYIGFIFDDNILLFNNKDVIIETESDGKSFYKISKKYLIIDDFL